MSFNKITLVGYLGRDPELKTTPQGTTMCKFSVATTERRKGATGEQEEFTTWFRVTVWGRQAELANEYLSKGRQVYVEGRLRIEEYVDREGNARFSPEVNATDLQFLGQRGDNQTTNAGVNAGVNAGANLAYSAPSNGAEKKQAVAVASVSLKGARKPALRKTNPALVSIEEDEVPF